MELISITLAAAIIGTGISAWIDYKTGYMPNEVTYAMIAIGGVLAPFIYQDLVYVYGLGIAVLAVGFLLYSFGQFGGGDMKLFTGLALLIPHFPQELAIKLQALGINPVVPSYPFIIPVFLLAGIIGPMLIHSLRNHLKIRENKENIENFRKKSIKGFILGLIPLPLFLVWFNISPAFTLLYIPMAITMYLIPFKEEMMELFHSKKKSIDKLNDDDVLFLEGIEKEKKDKLGLWRRTFTELEINKIKSKASQNNYTEVLVCENMPKFGPYIFISLIINLLLGDALLYAVMATAVF